MNVAARKVYRSTRCGENGRIARRRDKTVQGRNERRRKRSRMIRRDRVQCWGVERKENWRDVKNSRNE